MTSGGLAPVPFFSSMRLAWVHSHQLHSNETQKNETSCYYVCH
jgi:hypothetical protein